MPALDHVLIGTDLAPATDPVLRLGVALARSAGARLSLVHAYEVPPVWGGAVPLDVPGGQAVWLDDLRQRLHETLAAQAARCGLGAADEKLLRLGPPARVIADHARASKSSLVVVGAAPHRSWRALGSTADRVLRLAPCPVLLMRPGLELPPRRVLAPVDLSALSAQALRAGLDLLGRIGAPPEWIEVLFVLHPLERESSLHFSGEQIDRFAADELRRFADRAAAGTPPARVHPRVRVGYPQREILGALDETHADLLLIGTHGRSGFERLLLGSVTAEAVRESAVSALVLPPGAALEAALGEPEEAARAWADWQHVSDVVIKS
jgi:nucleotide-binding universal stress UspA family protein